MVESLKTRPAQSVVVAMTLVTLVTTVLVWIAMQADEAIMQAVGGYGIVDYELAFTTERASVILAAWGPTGRLAARHSLWVDYGFMPSYGLLFAGIALLIARRLGGKFQRLGLRLTLAPLVAAAFDAIENVMLLIVLSAGEIVPSAPILAAGICASVKFLLLAVVLGFWLVTGVAWAMGHILSPK